MSKIEVLPRALEFVIQDHDMNPVPVEHTTLARQTHSQEQPVTGGSRPAPNRQIDILIQVARGYFDASGHFYPIIDPALRAEEYAFLPEEHAQLALLNAQHNAARKKAIAHEKHTYAESLAARLGHPHAAQDGGWSILNSQDQGILLSNLEDLVHCAYELRNAGLPENCTRAPEVDFFFSEPKCKAVSIDCDFVGVGPRNRDALARVCAVDVLSGEVLLDILVHPKESITDFRPRYSGITEMSYYAYAAQGLLLPSPAEVRERLFEFIDTDTIIIGHALHNDLSKLGITHSRIIDTQILTFIAVQERFERELKRRWSLRDLSKTFLGLSIQDSPFGHDCLEDAFAPRELVLFWVDSLVVVLVRVEL
ncbi:ribonuclease H-like domain-containing protein [Aspergillus venezuelensis]